MNHGRTSCLDPETLAAFAEGRLSRDEVIPVLAHLRHCAGCTADLEALSEQMPVQSSLQAPRRTRMQWLAAAAAIVIAIMGAGAFLFRDRIGAGHDPIGKLAALTPRDARIVEPRLTGGFAWSPYQGPMRAANGGPDPGRLKLAGAAGEILENANRDPSPAAQRAAGVALILVERPMDAIANLRAAAKASPRDAQVRSDLAAAQYAAAAQLRTPSLYPAALADADAALRIDARLAEALFNRALILERLGLTQAARDAWQRYLDVDPSSPWANEARQRLQRLPETTSDAQFRSEQPRLERAAMAGEAREVAELVNRFRQQSRAFGEGEYLGHWGEAEQRGDRDAAYRQLTIARAIGDALATVSGERLLQEAVRAVDAANADQRRQLAEAHVAYRRGRIAYSRQLPAAAADDLLHAAQLFAGGKSTMSLVARYYAANTRFDRRDVAGARAELETLLGELEGRAAFTALAAHVRWELALCLMNDDDWSGALPLASRAAKGFCDLGESNNCGFVETLHAGVLAALGRPDEAWAATIRSFEMLSATGRGDRLPVSIGGAVLMELRSGHLAAARSLTQLEREAQRDTGNDVIVANTLARQAVLEAQLGDRAAAAASAHEAAIAAARIHEPALEQRALADVDFARGAVAAHQDGRRAEELLGRAIERYRAAQAPLFLAESHLLRSRIRRLLGDSVGARRDLQDGIAAYERHPVRLRDGVVGTGVLDAGTALYEDAIAAALSDGDHAAAFAYVERSLAQLGATTAIADLAELQRRLQGSGAMLLELAVLPAETIAFAVSGDRAEVHRQPIAAGELTSLADAAARGDQSALTSLYDLLIRPSVSQLGAARRMIVVAGPRLEQVPFAALVDSATRRTLIEQLPISMSATASALRRRERPAVRRSMLAVELASDDVGLPESLGELADVRGLYAGGASIAHDRATLAGFFDAARSADVIHLSGHSSGEPSAVETELLLGPRHERLSWRSLSPARLSRSPVVVLAACNTLRTPRAPSMRGLSLGSAFLAAGADDVIGTITPIADSDARLFFYSVHRSLAAGADAAEAVRQAQLEFMRDARRTAWRSVAVMTTRI